MKRKLSLFAAVVLISGLVLAGCAAVQHRNLDVQAKVSETIFLNPETLSDAKIYVRVTNTSDMQDTDFDQIIQGPYRQAALLS